MLEWVAGAEGDMWADSVLSVLLQVDGSPELVRFTGGTCDEGCGGGGKGATEATPQWPEPEDGLSAGGAVEPLRKHLGRFFGQCQEVADGSLEVTADGATATVTVRPVGKWRADVSVASEDSALLKAVQRAAERCLDTLSLGGVAVPAEPMEVVGEEREQPE